MVDTTLSIGASQSNGPIRQNIENIFSPAESNRVARAEPQVQTSETQQATESSVRDSQTLRAIRPVSVPVEAQFVETDFETRGLPTIDDIPRSSERVPVGTEPFQIGANETRAFVAEQPIPGQRPEFNLESIRAARAQEEFVRVSSNLQALSGDATTSLAQEAFESITTGVDIRA